MVQYTYLIFLAVSLTLLLPLAYETLYNASVLLPKSFGVLSNCMLLVDPYAFLPIMPAYGKVRVIKYH